VNDELVADGRSQSVSRRRAVPSPATMDVRKSINTSHAVLSCDVCGRTLLRGERADPYIAGGSRRMVCELCEARAANEGWIRESADNTLAARGHGGRSGRSFFERLRAGRDDGTEPTAEPDAGSRRARLARSSRPDGEPARPEPHGDAQPPVPPSERHEGAREPRQVHAVPTNADLKMGRALDVFNASPHPRRMAGIARSLGTPSITVLPSETEGSMVSIVVAWELCWYRYEVDLADEAAGVRVIGQGAELSELGAEEQHPNAAADEGGRLALAA